MKFFKNIYQITRITGSQDNIFGVAFNNKNKSDNNKEARTRNGDRLYYRKKDGKI